MIEKSYHRCRFGQLHVRRLEPRGDVTNLPLLCLHPSPFSGEYFATLMPLLNEGRELLAPDYPGYGGSDAPDGPPTIGDYAAAMFDLLDDIGIDSVDVLGFHTGCLVGADMSLHERERIGALVLIDVPYHDGEERTMRYDGSVDPDTLKTDRKQWGFHAAYTYASDERLNRLATPTTVIGTNSALLDATRDAAGVIPGARLVERPDITKPVFGERVELIAAAIEAALA